MTTIHQLIVETWVEYGIATIVVIMRMFTRFKMVGLRGLDYDDYLMPVAWIFFTAMSAMAHVVAQSGDNANMTNEYRKNLSTAEFNLRTRGSKAFIVGWFTYTGMLWTLKICWLGFFGRVTSGLSSSKFIKPLLVAVLATWVGIIFMLVLACRPFHHMWQMYPDPGKHCTPENPVFYITVLVVNLITDGCIVLIPLPVLHKAQLPLMRKIALMILLSAGGFVMIAAILRVAFVFKNADAATPAIWACRETLVAMIVSNAPMIRPLFSLKFWRGEHGSSNKSSYVRSGTGKDHIELSSGKSTSTARIFSSKKLPDDDTSSTEHIVKPMGMDSSKAYKQMGITVRQDIDIDSKRTMSSSRADSRV